MSEFEGIEQIEDEMSEPSNFEEDYIVPVSYVNDDEEPSNEPTGESQDNNEDTTEPQGEEFEEWEYPEFIPDDFVVPDEFKSPKQELAWYKDKYIELMDHYRKDDFVESVKNNHVNLLLGNEERVEAFKAFEALVDGNPDLALKLYAPQVYVQNGQDYKPSEEEVFDYLDKQLAKEFGKNYKNAYDPDDALDPDTLSGKMFLRQEQIKQWVEERGSLAEESVQPHIPVDPQVVLDKEYETVSHAMNREEYDAFIADVRADLIENPLSVKDLYLLYNIDEIAEEIYEQGKLEGMRSTGKSISTYGRQAPLHEDDDFNDTTFDPHFNVYNNLRI